MDADGRKRGSKRRTAVRVLLYPLILLEKGLSALLGKCLGEGYGDVTEDDILSMVDAGNENGTIETASVEMINNVFEFDDLDASDVMTHRVNIVAVEEDTKMDKIVYLALEEGFSRIPVYRESVDCIVGLIIVKDLLCLIGNEHSDDYKAKDFMRDIAFVPEMCSCADTFKQLTATKSGMAVVLDEYGGTAGIVTIEDLIEAIMGNIQDEYDDEDVEIKKIGKEKYEVDGECDPDDVLVQFGYHLPEEHEFDTIAGFVTDLLGYIPENTAKPPHADYQDLRFVVLDVEDNCISRLIVFRRDPDERRTIAENE